MTMQARAGADRRRLYWLAAGSLAAHLAMMGLVARVVMGDRFVLFAGFILQAIALVMGWRAGAWLILLSAGLHLTFLGNFPLGLIPLARNPLGDYFPPIWAAILAASWHLRYLTLRPRTVYGTLAPSAAFHAIRRGDFPPGTSVTDEPREPIPAFHGLEAATEFLRPAAAGPFLALFAWTVAPLALQWFRNPYLPASVLVMLYLFWVVATVALIAKVVITAIGGRRQPLEAALLEVQDTGWREARSELERGAIALARAERRWSRRS